MKNQGFSNFLQPKSKFIHGCSTPMSKSLTWLDASGLKAKAFRNQLLTWSLKSTVSKSVSTFVAQVIKTSRHLSKAFYVVIIVQLLCIFRSRSVLTKVKLFNDESDPKVIQIDPNLPKYTDEGLINTVKVHKLWIITESFQNGSSYLLWSTLSRKRACFEDLQVAGRTLCTLTVNSSTLDANKMWIMQYIFSSRLL